MFHQGSGSEALQVQSHNIAMQHFERWIASCAREGYRYWLRNSNIWACSYATSSAAPAATCLSYTWLESLSSSSWNPLSIFSFPDFWWTPKPHFAFERSLRGLVTEIRHRGQLRGTCAHLSYPMAWTAERGRWAPLLARSASALKVLCRQTWLRCCRGCLGWFCLRCWTVLWSQVRWR